MHPFTRTIITLLSFLGLLAIVVNAIYGSVVGIIGGALMALSFGYLALFAAPYEGGEQ